MTVLVGKSELVAADLFDCSFPGGDDCVVGVFGADLGDALVAEGGLPGVFGGWFRGEQPVMRVAAGWAVLCEQFGGVGIDGAMLVKCPWVV